MQGTHTQRSTQAVADPGAARVAGDRRALGGEWVSSMSSAAKPTTDRGGSATTNVAIEWNAIASTAIMTTAAQPPHVAVLSMAMVQGAVYDAVNAIDGGHRAVPRRAAGEPERLDGGSGRNRRLPRAWSVSRERTPPLAGVVPSSQLAALQPLYDAYAREPCPTGLRRRAGSRSVRRLRPRC